jgi:hypothetical protein
LLWATGVRSWWKIANGELQIGEKGKYSTAIHADLRDADAEYLIVAPCGFNLERSLQEQTVSEQYPWWCELQAVRLPAVGCGRFQGCTNLKSAD